MHMSTHGFTLDIYMRIKDQRAIPVPFLLVPVLQRFLPLISHKVSQCPDT